MSRPTWNDLETKSRQPNGYAAFGRIDIGNETGTFCLVVPLLS